MLNMQNNMEDQDWNIKEDSIFDKLNEVTTGWFNRNINIDWEAATAKRLTNVNYKTKSTKIDYKSFQKQRLSNIDNKIRNAKISATKSKPVLQFDKQGNFIKEFNSAKEATITMGKPGKDDIGRCCRGMSKSAYGFIWKFKDN